MMRECKTVSFSAVADYWCVSRSRIDLWERVMERLSEVEEVGDVAGATRWWDDHHTVVEEIFVGDMLTRVLAAFVGEFRVEGRNSKVAPVLDAIFLLHLDTRGEVRRAMLRHQHRAARQHFSRLNRVRLAVEHWTDSLIAWVQPAGDHQLAYGFCESRMQRVREELDAVEQVAAAPLVMNLMSSAMMIEMKKLLRPECALPQANHEVLQSAMKMFGTGAFDELGMMKPIGKKVSGGGEQCLTQKISAPHPAWHSHLSKIVDYLEPVNAKAASNSPPRSDRWHL